MSKINSILPQIKSILQKRSRSLLKQDLIALGGTVSNKTKQLIIADILNKVHKNNDKKMALLKIINQSYPAIQIKNQTHLQQKQEKEKSVNKNIELKMSLNWSYLQDINKHQDKMMEEYAKHMGGRRLIDELHNQLTEKQKKQLRQQIEAKMEALQDEQVYQEDVISIENIEDFDKPFIQMPKKQVQSEVKEQQNKRNHLPNKKLYIVNDISNNEQKLKQLSQIWLSELNASSQIVYAKYKIQKNYQTLIQDLRKMLVGQDVANFNKYIQNQISKQLNTLLRYSKRYKVKLMSQAIFTLKTIKQYEYYIKPNLFDLINSTNDKLENIQSIIANIDKNQQLFQQILHIKNEQQLVQLIKQFEQIIQITTIDLTKQKIINICFKICSQLIAKSEQKEISQQISNNLVSKWLSTVNNVKINEIESLKNALYNLFQFDKFASLLQQKLQADIEQIYSNEKYQKISKQVGEAMLKLFSNDQTNAPLSAQDINQIIYHFHQVFGEAELPQQIITGCIINASNSIGKLNIKTKKSLLYLLNKIQQNDDDAIIKLIQAVLQSNINLSLKQVIIALQIATKNQINNKSDIISQIILCNIDPKQINAQVKQFIIKVVNQNIGKQQDRDKIIEYLNIQK